MLLDCRYFVWMYGCSMYGCMVVRYEPPAGLSENLMRIFELHCERNELN